ncbi:hypothetical protein NP493_318g01033 [Ridgeia piscesae]|uniref:Low-density lipoprotein receptor repeat class B n=1 Tax=Ridgeia piscesae TaxID=27915 RepID=A0AAD9NVW1_RIDPI|nr:hypothetical protein NP493_318g01033 [Ridgeia piscesae]
MSLCFPDTDTLYSLVVVARPDILKVPVISNVIPPRYGTPIEITYGGNQSRAIAVDAVHGVVYWTDGGLIKRAALDGNYSHVILDAVDADLTRLAVDPIKEKIYFTDFTGETAGMVNTDGSGRQALFNETGRLRGIAVDYKAGLLFRIWKQSIHRSNLDGSEDIEIVSSSNTTWRKVLAINCNSKNTTNNKKICWTDYRMKIIECSDYNGDNRDVYNTTGWPLALQMANDVIYYTQHHPNSVNTIQLKDGNRSVIDMGPYNGRRMIGIDIILADCTTAATSGR